MYSPACERMKLPSREGMVSSTQIGRIPVNETLEVNQRDPISGLTGKRAGITGCPRPTVFRGLPVMVHLHMNPTITCRVTGRCTRGPIVGNKSRVPDVESEIVLSPPAVRPPSVGSVIAVGRVLEGCARPLDTVNLDKEATGRTRRMPARWGRSWRQPALCNTSTNRCSYSWTPGASIERSCPGLIMSDIRYPNSRRSTADIGIPRPNR